MKFEVFKDEVGEWRWHLRAKNGQVIATSGEGYKRKRSALRAIDRIKGNAEWAPVIVEGQVQ